jgi:hypothetical protein
MDQETQHQSPTDISTASSDPEIEEILQELEALEGRFGRLIEGRTRESLQQPGEDGHWGVVEVLCYLRDSEQVIADHVRRMLMEDRPAFEEVDATMWPLEHEYREQDSHEVFADLSAQRQELVDVLRGIEPGAWDRVGVMSDGEEITLRALLERVVLHDDRYLQKAREAVA